MKNKVIFFTACFCIAGATASIPPIQINHKVPFGRDDVSIAQKFGADGKLEEGRAFIAELRKRPTDGRNLEERQSVDMAEFAFLRSNLEANKTRCIECLKSVYDAGSTSFWGWAAYSYLKDFGVDVKQPKKDPLCGLGEWGNGVVNLQPRILEFNSKKVKEIQEKFESLLAKRVTYPSKLSSNDLVPGSSVRRAILRGQLVKICGTKNIAEILSTDKGNELFSRLWNDDATLEDFLLSGPVFDPPCALKTLMTIFLNDEQEGWTKTDMGRRSAVATAINSLKEDDLVATVRYWAAFRRIGMHNRFVPETAKRDCREWRFIVRRPVDASEILYLNAVVKFPKSYITNLTINNVPYRKVNCLGERKLKNKYKRNAGYYSPWLETTWPKAYIRSCIGGICVEQAHWGARCANAHGIMAETARQPGRKATKFRKGGPPHQCWLFREENGNWRLVNSIRPYTGAEFVLWGKGYQYLVSVERAFADRVAHDESELLLFAGHVREAALRCPYNWTAWRAYTDSLITGNAPVKDWQSYLGELLKVAPEGRQASWDFAYEAIAALEKAGVDKDVLAKEVEKVFATLVQPKTKISEEMDYNKHAISRFLKKFNDSIEIEENLTAVALKANSDSASYLPHILDYAIKRFGDQRERLSHLLTISVSSGDDGESKDGINWRNLYSSKGVLEDIDAFRVLADLRNEINPPTGDQKVLEVDYGAPLVSGDALLRTSSSVKNDTLEDYPRVSDATSYDSKLTGYFKTRKQVEPFAIVELPGNAVIKGVTVLGAPDDLVVWVSQNGDTWTAVGKVGKSDYRVDLCTNPQTVKFVKVGFAPSEGKRQLSLKKILVYGDRLY